MTLVFRDCEGYLMIYAGVVKTFSKEQLSWEMSSISNRWEAGEDGLKDKLSILKSEHNRRYSL
jgi:hypothetical protein